MLRYEGHLRPRPRQACACACASVRTGGRGRRLVWKTQCGYRGLANVLCLWIKTQHSFPPEDGHRFENWEERRELPLLIAKPEKGRIGLGRDNRPRTLEPKDVPFSVLIFNLIFLVKQMLNMAFVLLFSPRSPSPSPLRHGAGLWGFATEPGACLSLGSCSDYLVGPAASALFFPAPPQGLRPSVSLSGW